MPLSKSQAKLINSLQIKKYRYKNGLFIAEGIKVVNEFLNSSFELESLFSTENAIDDYSKYKPELITDLELNKISSFKNPNKVLALFKIPLTNRINNKNLKIVLDDVNDPGNLGTIIRLCDWFGVEELICSDNTVDCYNSKVIQSTMGSLSRVSIYYTDIKEYLHEIDQPTFIADMDGDNIYKTKLPENAIIVMGNEANGVSKEVKDIVQNKISIPRFGVLRETESLNVATATSIILSEFKRSIGMLK